MRTRNMLLPVQMLSRRDFLQVGSAAAVAASIPFDRAKAARGPNIIAILSDDLGWGDLPSYGGSVARTPFLDALARGGLRFSSFYAASPVCSPSRAAFLTGRFPSELAIHLQFSASPTLNAQRGMPNALDPEVPTIAQMLRDAGYATGHFGKWHLGNISPDRYGFDASRTYSMRGKTDWADEPLFWQRSSELIADAAIGFIKREHSRPFYVDIWTHAVHAPLDPSKPQMEPFDNLRTKDVSGTFTTPLEVYYGSLAEMDRNVGRILAALDDLGIADDTIVFFSSDNGPEDIRVADSTHSAAGNPGPFRGRKRSLYEGGIREPFIVRWPGHVPAGAVDDRTVMGAVDLLPTIARLCGVALPPNVHTNGVDMSAAFLGTAVDRARPLFWEYRDKVIGDVINMSPMMAIRDGRQKLLMNPDGSRVELYDLGKDFLEVDNLATVDAERARPLMAELLAWHGSLPGSPLPKGTGEQVIPWPQPE